MVMDTQNAHSQDVVDNLNKVLSRISDVDALDETLRWLDDEELTDLTEHLAERFDLSPVGS
jgi:hypothetical protein